MNEGIQSARSDNPRDEALVNVVAGMISTIEFVPAIHHPDHNVQLAARIVEQIRRWDSPEVSIRPGDKYEEDRRIR